MISPAAQVADMPPEPVDARARIVDLHGRLARRPSLEPGPVVDALFTHLVAACLAPAPEEAERLVDHPDLVVLGPDLRRMCATGEELLERAWARRVLADGDPFGALDGFPYLDNYRRLTRLEVHALLGVGMERARARRVAFLGGGPLPLSAMLLARELDVEVDVVDVCPEATALADAVARRLGARGVAAHHADAATWAGVADADVVVLAALVGADAAQKRVVLDAVRRRMRPGALLVARSASRLRTLLYPPLPPRWAAGWEPLAVVDPLDDVVNSVVVARRPH